MKSKKWRPYPRYIFRKEIALSLIKKYVPKQAAFLEIGCASGDFGISLAKRGNSGLMIDFSDEAREQVEYNLKKNPGLNVKFIKTDFQNFEADRPFDLVTMFEVLEHVEKENELLKKIRTLLAPDGFFMLSVPAGKKYWGPSDTLTGHLRRYEKNGLIQLLDENGFEVIRFLSYGFPFLNIIRIIRERAAGAALKKTDQACRIKLTEKSGLNPGSLKLPILSLFFNRYFLYLPIRISCLFNNMDLAEGYLCLCRKK